MKVARSHTLESNHQLDLCNKKNATKHATFLVVASIAGSVELVASGICHYMGAPACAWINGNEWSARNVSY